MSSLVTCLTMEGQIGDYTLVKKIGAGSLGITYVAEHKYFKKQYALKILSEELSQNRPFMQRFEDEISHLATLDHPNIVKIHNISYVDGKYFIVSDCIVDEWGETTNLAKWFAAKNKQVSETELLSVLKQVGDALDYMHSKKIVHRSLKLNNILEGKGGRFYISDCGLARLIGVSSVLTRTFRVVADSVGLDPTFEQEYPTTPIDGKKLLPVHNSFLQNFAFLAPEQKRIEKIANIDFRADVYAYGILGYYLLLGEYPEGYFPMPGKKWEALIKSCLSTSPETRPTSLKEALALLDVPALQSSSSSEGGLRPLIQSSKLKRPDVDADPAQALIVDSTVKLYTPERGDHRLIEPIQTDMVVIKGGVFARGSNNGSRDEMPFHQVLVKSFAIDVHPVTNEQFVLFLEAMGGEKDSNHNDLIRLKDARIKRAAGKLSIESGYAKHPVVGVTWYGATAYATWVGKRLPFEAEWEIAAKAGNPGAIYPFGDEIDKTKANYFSSDTTAVMSYPPNPIGLYDLAGNVYEWCNDWYSYNFYETSIVEPEYPKGPLQGVYRVLRGGCWKSLKEDLRCAHRNRNNPGTVNSTYGFRCATDVS